MERKLIGLFRPKPGESEEEFKERVKKALRQNGVFKEKKENSKK